MAVYIITLLLCVIFACMAMYYPKTVQIKLASCKRAVTFQTGRMLIFCSFLSLFLISALRYRVGGDYVGYERIFTNLQNGAIDVYTEAGFTLLNKIVIELGGNIQYVYAICAFIILTAFFYGIYSYSPNPPLSIFLFVTMGYLFSSFNIMRQFVSVAVLFAALKFVKERKFLPYLLVVIFAMTFHKTAIIMLPLYFIVNLNLKQSYRAIILLIAACFLPFKEKFTTIIVNIFYPSYVGTNLIKPLSTFETVYYIVVFGLILFLCTRYKEQFFKDKYNLIIYNCVFYSLLIYLCFPYIPEINRIALYLEIFVILLIPRMIKAEENAKVRRLYYLAVIIVFFAFMLVSVGLMGRYSVLPYTSIIS